MIDFELFVTTSTMANEKDTTKTKSKEGEEDKRRKQVPVEVHNTRNGSNYAISEASDESLTS